MANNLTSEPARSQTVRRKLTLCRKLAYSAVCLVIGLAFAEAGLRARAWARYGTAAPNVPDEFVSYDKALGLLLAQLLPEFQAEPKTEPMFFGNVGRMTPRGHELTANLIGEFLEQRQLLPDLGLQQASHAAADRRYGLIADVQRSIGPTRS